jgi:hypothetical protein
MGNSVCPCIRYFLSRDRLQTLTNAGKNDEHVQGDIESGPRYAFSAAADGPYIDIKVIDVYPEGLLKVTFKYDFAGTYLPIYVTKHVIVSGLQVYPGCDLDIKKLFQGEHRARLRIEHDRGCVYVGKVYIEREQPGLFWNIVQSSGKLYTAPIARESVAPIQPDMKLDLSTSNQVVPIVTSVSVPSPNKIIRGMNELVSGHNHITSLALPETIGEYKSNNQVTEFDSNDTINSTPPVESVAPDIVVEPVTNLDITQENHLETIECKPGTAVLPADIDTFVNEETEDEDSLEISKSIDTFDIIEDQFSFIIEPVKTL